jgi:hypothetical protein
MSGERRWFQFHFKTLIVAMIVASIFLFFLVARHRGIYDEGFPRDLIFFLVLLLFISAAYEWALRNSEKNSKPK